MCIWILICNFIGNYFSIRAIRSISKLFFCHGSVEGHMMVKPWCGVYCSGVCPCFLVHFPQIDPYCLPLRQIQGPKTCWQLLHWLSAIETANTSFLVPPTSLKISLSKEIGIMFSIYWDLDLLITALVLNYK